MMISLASSDDDDEDAGGGRRRAAAGKRARAGVVDLVAADEEDEEDEDDVVALDDDDEAVDLDEALARQLQQQEDVEAARPESKRRRRRQRTVQVRLAQPCGSELLRPLEAWATSRCVREAEQDVGEEVDLEAADAHGRWVDANFPAGLASICGSTRDPSLPAPAAPRCGCGLAAVQKTVSRETVNTGRRFWTCGKRKCGFFRWADASEWTIPASARKHVWQRPPQWPAYPRVVSSVEGFRADDVRQGRVGDCWFISALSVLALRPDLGRGLFVSLEAQPRGGPYFVRLFIDGRWQAIAVDDQFPCWPVEATMKKPAGVNPDFNLSFAKPSRNLLWVPLVEKAYAKAHGSYAAIQGGWVAEALFDLTGCPTETFRIGGGMPAEDLFQLLVSFSEAGFLMGASCLTPGKGSGLVGGHAYGVLDVRVTRRRLGAQPRITTMLGGGAASSSSSSAAAAEEEALRLIKLRNPWGRYEWKGDFSRQSALWTTALRRELGHADKEDGSFWMRYEDFLAHFASGSVDVCKTPRPHEEWFLTPLEIDFRRAEWWGRHVIELHAAPAATGPTWAYVSVCQPTKRGKTRGVFAQTDASILVLQQRKRTPRVAALCLPGQCKAHHFDLFLEADTKYWVILFSLNRSHGAGSASQPAQCHLRVLSARPLRWRRCTIGGPRFVVHYLHEAFLQRLRAPLAVARAVPRQPNFRLVDVRGFDDADALVHVGALESPGGLLVVAVNTSEDRFASIDLLVMGLVEGRENDNARANTYCVPPRSSRVLAAVANAGFDDYKWGLANSETEAAGLRTFYTSEAVVAMLRQEVQTQHNHNPTAISRPVLPIEVAA